MSWLACTLPHTAPRRLFATASAYGRRRASLAVAEPVRASRLLHFQWYGESSSLSTVSSHNQHLIRITGCVRHGSTMPSTTLVPSPPIRNQRRPWATRSHAIEIQPKSVYGNELAGLRTEDVARRAAAVATCWPGRPKIMIAEMTTANRKPVRDCLIVGSSRSWTTRSGFIPRCASAHIAIASGDQRRDERLGWVTQTAVCKTCDSEEGYSPL
jgi:hypothetical protein